MNDVVFRNFNDARNALPSKFQDATIVNVLKADSPVQAKIKNDRSTKVFNVNEGMSRKQKRRGAQAVRSTEGDLAVGGDLKVMYTNADSLLNKRDELHALIDIHKPLIIGIVEV